MKRWVGALAFLGATAVASSAMGQEIQLRGPLAGAPSCRQCVEYRAGRLTLAPTFGITLQDEYDRAMFVGLNAQYHFNDIVALGVWGAYAVAHVNTGLTSQIEANPGGDQYGNIPDRGHFSRQIGQLNWFLSAPQLTVIPLRGKLALFQNIFIDTDFYLFAGLGIIGLSERQNYDETNTLPSTLLTNGASNIQRSQRVAFTGTFGAGLNFYITHFLSLGVEYRAFPFNWNTSGTDENTTANKCGPAGMSSCAGFPDYQVNGDRASGGGGRTLIDGTDQAFHWNQMLNFSLTFFLPFEPRRGQ